MSQVIFDKIYELLSSQNAKFRVIEHAAVRTSQEAAQVRNTKPEQGAKALVCVIKGVNFENLPAQTQGGEIRPQNLSENLTQNSVLKGGRCYVLAVLPGHLKANLDIVAHELGGTRASLASPAETAELTDCVFGSVPPFSFHERLLLVVDPSLFELNDEIAFNAGLLDRSIVLNAADYARITRPMPIKFASNE